jgi:monoterpene epsilon-lactone hydrolase
MSMRAPGQISPEAEAWLAASSNVAVSDLSAIPMPEIRAQVRAAWAPTCDRVVAETGVALSEAEFGGRRCLVIDPPGRREGRVILYAFGGGYTLGCPEDDLTISAPIARTTGARIVAPYYRLAPEHPFPAGLEDVEAVARTLLAGTDQVAFAGESAGGSLLLSTLHRLRASGAPMPVAAALMSPGTDKSHYGDSFEAARDPSLAVSRVRQIGPLYAPGADMTKPDISPIYGRFDAGFPPVLLTTGTRDLLLSQVVRLARVMREGGASVDLRVWEGLWHVFEFYPDIPEARASLAEIGAFLDARFA